MSAGSKWMSGCGGRAMDDGVDADGRPGGDGEKGDGSGGGAPPGGPPRDTGTEHGARGTARNIPNWSRVFVRGVGWIDVRKHPCRAQSRWCACVIDAVARVSASVKELIGVSALTHNFDRGLAAHRRLTRRHRPALVFLERASRGGSWYAFDSTLGYPGEGPPKSVRYHLQIGCAFQNIYDLRNKTFRQNYLRSMRSKFKILALAETQSSSEVEELWARDWGAGPAVWASGEEQTRARGVALLMADEIMPEDLDVVWADPEGRSLVVAVTVYGKHKLAIAVSHMPSDPLEAKLHARLIEAKLDSIPDIEQRGKIWLGDFNCVMNSVWDEIHLPLLFQRAIAAWWKMRAPAPRKEASRGTTRDAARQKDGSAQRGSSCGTRRGRDNMRGTQ